MDTYQSSIAWKWVSISYSRGHLCFGDWEFRGLHPSVGGLDSWCSRALGGDAIAELMSGSLDLTAVNDSSKEDILDLVIVERGIFASNAGSWSLSENANEWMLRLILLMSL